MISATVGQSSWEKEIRFLIRWAYMQRIFRWELHVFYVGSGLAGRREEEKCGNESWHMKSRVTCFFYLPSSAISLCFPPPWWERERAFPLWVRWHLQDRKRRSQFTSGLELQAAIFPKKSYAEPWGQQQRGSVDVKINQVTRQGVAALGCKKASGCCNTFNSAAERRKRRWRSDRRRLAGHLCNCDPGWQCSGGCRATCILAGFSAIFKASWLVTSRSPSKSHGSVPETGSPSHEWKAQIQAEVASLLYYN